MVAQVLLELLGSLDRRERQEPPAALVPQEELVALEILVTLVHLVILADQEALVFRVAQVPLATQDSLEQRANLATLVRQAPREALVPLAVLGKMDPPVVLDRKVNVAPLGSLEPLVELVPQAAVDKVDSQVVWDRKVNLAHVVRLAILAELDQMDPPVDLDKRVCFIWISLFFLQNERFAAYNRDHTRVLMYGIAIPLIRTLKLFTITLDHNNYENRPCFVVFWFSLVSVNRMTWLDKEWTGLYV